MAMLYWSGSATAPDLQRMTDAELEGMRHQLQLAYATHLQNGGTGAFNSIGSGGNGGTATSTSRTQRTGNGGNSPGTGSGSGTWPGTGTTTDGTYRFNQNRTDTTGIDRDWAPVFFSGSDTAPDIQRANDTLLTDFFEAARDDILSGGVGCYRIQENSPGTEWTEITSNVFINAIYNDNDESEYNLYLHTTGTAPTGTFQNPMFAIDSDILILRVATDDEIEDDGDMMTEFMVRRFANWMIDNGYNLNISTTLAGGTNLSTFTDTRLNGTTDSGPVGDVYTSTPSGTQVTNTTYYLKAT